MLSCIQKHTTVVQNCNTRDRDYADLCRERVNMPNNAGSVSICRIMPRACHYAPGYAGIIGRGQTGNVVTVNGNFGDYFSIVEIKGSVEYESCMLICAARIVLI